MAEIIARFLPLLLLTAGVVLLFMTDRPFWRAGALAAKKATFKSLHKTSPLLNVLISISVIGKPFLEHLQKNNWTTDAIPSETVMPLMVIVIVSLYVMLGGVICFFFRAISNINFFNGAKVRSPYSVFFMLIPIANLIVIPYLEYFTYHRSRAIAMPGQASKRRAALLVLSAFSLLVISLACARLGEDASQSTIYDPLSLLILSLCTGGAGGILTTRIITGIARTQDLYARQRGMILDGGPIATAERRSRTIEVLKSTGIGILLIVALVTTSFPALPSRAIQAIQQAWPADEHRE